MKEPFLSRFRELIQQGAASQDIHDANGPGNYTAGDAVQSRFLEREVARVQAHQRHLLPLLEHFVGVADSILDVGCSSGGTTVALALSGPLNASHVVGIDPNGKAIVAARVRAQGFDIGPDRIRFEEIRPGEPLPFPDCVFDLVTCVSVLEFVSEGQSREFLASEMHRVTRPGGHLYLSTPSPWRLYEFHSKRLLGHIRRREGYPWSSSPSSIRRMFRHCASIGIGEFVVREMLVRRGFKLTLPLPIARLLAWGLPWQKHLFRKPRSTVEAAHRWG